MKIDENAAQQMISSEAPVMLSTAAEFLIEEMTLRAWLHTEQNRRKTIQKSDVAQGISGCEMFDFLIDIIPKDELRQKADDVSDSRASNGLEGHLQYLVSSHIWKLAFLTRKSSVYHGG